MEKSGQGALYIVSTPIGNLEDITLRALRILKEVDFVAAEDTRRTLQLLNHYEIKSRVESYHSFNEHHKTANLLDRISSGAKVALVTDAGTPCIADPGFLLIREAVKLGIEPVMIPGVSAMTFSISASGFPCEKFSFYGFLPVKSGRRMKELERIKADGKTSVIYESPYRMGKLLKEIAGLFGSDVQIAVIREATKLHEEILRGSAGDLAEKYGERNWKGECAVVIARQDENSEANDEGQED